jgi:hypothetical protein
MWKYLDTFFYSDNDIIGFDIHCQVLSTQPGLVQFESNVLLYFGEPHFEDTNTIAKMQLMEFFCRANQRVFQNCDRIL